MRRLLLLWPAIVIAILGFLAPSAWAGSAHFINNTMTASRTDSSLTVSGKEAGLGDLEQVNIVVNATAQCINPGDKHPKAANKEDIAAGEDVPVQNGKAEFSITATANISPSCSPPMTLVFSNISVTDTTNNVTFNFRGLTL